MFVGCVLVVVSWSLPGVDWLLPVIRGVSAGVACCVLIGVRCVLTGVRCLSYVVCCDGCGVVLFVVCCVVFSCLCALFVVW